MNNIKLSAKCIAFNEEAAILSEIPIEVIQKIIALEYQNSALYEALRWFVMAIEDGSLIVYTDDDQHKAVKDENLEKMDKLYSLIKEIENEPRT